MKRISTFLKFGHFLNVEQSLSLPFELIDKSKNSADNSKLLLLLASAEIIMQCRPDEEYEY